MATYDSPTLDGVTSVHVRDVAPDISLLLLDHPLADELMARKTPCFAPRVEWHDNAMRPDFVLLDSTETATSGDTTILVNGDQTSWMRANMVLRSRVTGEMYRVSAVGAYDSTTTSTSLTVERGFGYTSATEHTASATANRLDVVSVASLEGAAFAATILNSFVQRTNRTQIFREAWSVTGTELESVGVNGVTGVIYAEKEKLAMETVAQTLARSIYVGSQHASTPQGSATVARFMDGIAGQVAAGLALSTNAHYVDVSGADYNSTDAVDNLLAQITLVHDYGGKVTDIYCNSRIINQLTKDGATGQAVRQVNGADTLTRTVRTFMGPYGAVAIHADQACPQDMIFLIDKPKVKLRELRPFRVLQMGIAGDSRDYLLVGEYSLEVKDAFRGGHYVGYKAAA